MTKIRNVSNAVMTAACIACLMALVVLAFVGGIE